MRGLVNAGFQRGMPVLRTHGPQHTPTEFHVFSPVVMAAIGVLPDTIVDRAVNIRLRRRKPVEMVGQFRSGRHATHLHTLRDELAVWAGERIADLAAAEPTMPVEDRAADLWEPLVAVGDAAGGSWPGRARAAAVALTAAAAQADSVHSTGAELLADVRTVLDNRSDGPMIRSSHLLDALLDMEEARWHDDQLSTRRLSDLLKPYEIFPTRMPSGDSRGYRVAAFRDAFERYLTVQVTARGESQAGTPGESRAPSAPPDGS